MNLENSNLYFDPKSWEKHRKKGMFKFVFIPSFFIVIITFAFFYFIENTTKGSVTQAIVLSLLAALILFSMRIATWYWKEYKFARYTQNDQSYLPKDVLIFMLNLIRIVLILGFYVSILLYSLGFYPVDWGSLFK